MIQLLNGIRVLDFTSVVLGPYATQVLGDLGADVIKVEPLQGDGFRAVRPGRTDDMGAGFLNLNRNKRSIAIDLRSEPGRAVLEVLVKQADLVLHNMRPASAERLGIGFERLKSINPRIAYCYTAGFGSGGRYSEEPAYDDIIQARSGLACLNANAAGEPRFLPTIVADKVGGLHLAIGALAAFCARQESGEAVSLEVPMFESMVSFLLTEQLAGRSFVPPMGKMGYERLLSPYRKPYHTSDGFIAVLPYTTLHWTRFLQLIGREDMQDDSRVTDPVQRSQNIDMLYEMIEQAMADRTTAEWLEELGKLDIPCAPVEDMNSILEDPHLREVGMFEAVDHPTEGRMLRVRSPFRSGDPEPDVPAPKLGADTRDLLSEIGYSDTAINDLFDQGVVASAASLKEAS